MIGLRNRYKINGVIIWLKVKVEQEEEQVRRAGTVGKQQSEEQQTLRSHIKVKELKANQQQIVQAALEIRQNNIIAP